MIRVRETPRQKCFAEQFPGIEQFTDVLDGYPMLVMVFHRREILKS